MLFPSLSFSIVASKPDSDLKLQRHAKLVLSPANDIVGHGGRLNYRRSVSARNCETTRHVSRTSSYPIRRETARKGETDLDTSRSSDKKAIEWVESRERCSCAL